MGVRKLTNGRVPLLRQNKELSVVSLPLLSVEDEKLTEFTLGQNHNVASLPFWVLETRGLRAESSLF